MVDSSGFCEEDAGTTVVGLLGVEGPSLAGATGGRTGFATGLLMGGVVTGAGVVVILGGVGTAATVTALPESLLAGVCDACFGTTG